MRFMMIVKGNAQSETGQLPDEETLATMQRYNEELQKAGVLLDLSGLHASKKGARIKYQGQKRTVVDGPFAEAKELIAGYWLIQVKSREEAIEWAKRVPFQEGEVELRQLVELEEFQQGPAIEHAKRIGEALKK